ALTQAFGASTKEKGFCALGSVKTNVGHLDAAAGDGIDQGGAGAQAWEDTGEPALPGSEPEDRFWEQSVLRERETEDVGAQRKAEASGGEFLWDRRDQCACGVGGGAGGGGKRGRESAAVVGVVGAERERIGAWNGEPVGAYKRGARDQCGRCGVYPGSGTERI